MVTGPGAGVAGGQTAQEWFVAGERALADGDAGRAANAFRRAIALDGEHANALFRLGELAERSGARSRAVEYYERALRAVPTHVSARVRLDALRATPPASAAKAGPKHEPTPGRVFGVVSALQQRYEQDVSRRPVFVVTFRVSDPRPGSGSPTVHAVELRGRSMTGSLVNGEWVELPADWRPGRPARRLRNLTTGEQVSVGDGGDGLRWVTIAIAALVVVVFLAILVTAGSLILEALSRR